MSERLAGVTLVPQPSPAINPGGDCFACALTAGLRHLFPERAEEITVERVHRYFWRDVGGKPHLDNTWSGFRDALYAAFSDDFRLDVRADLVQPRWDPEQWAHEWWHVQPDYEWGQRLEAWLAAGWLAASVISYEGSPTGQWQRHEDGKVYRATHDHFVLLDGVRWGWRKSTVVEGASSLVYQVHVVCSSRAGRTYWIDVDDFLREHGAAAWWLFRRETRGVMP